MLKSLAVFIATLGGLGRVRVAPGTWGSLVGLLGGLASLHWYSWPWWVWLAILGLKFVVCAMICTVAERALGVHDAPSIILDEAWAMGAIVIVTAAWCGTSVLWMGAGFLLFRIFDIVKPFPLNWLGRLPAGWGIMADDFGAAVYTILALIIVPIILLWSGVLKLRIPFL